MFELVPFGSHPATVLTLAVGACCKVQKGSHIQSSDCNTRHTRTVFHLLDDTTSALVFCLSDRTQHGPHMPFILALRDLWLFSICFALLPVIPTVLKWKSNTTQRQTSLCSTSGTPWNQDLAKQWTRDASLG